MFIRVVSPYFVVGLEVKKGVVVSAAPIIGWAVGKEWDYVEAYFKKKGWEYSKDTVFPAFSEESGS